MYEIYLSINDKQGFNIPVLPEKLTIKEDGANETYQVINLGEVSATNKPKLTEISFDSFFPLHNAPYVSSKILFEPKFYVNKINEWRQQGSVIRFIFVGGAVEINSLCTIESFEIYEQAGEVGDIHYSMTLKQYKVYVARKVKIVKDNSSNSSKAKPSKKPSRPSKKQKTRNYTVKKGDCLWNIAKKYYGKGSKWPRIYHANGKKIKNPNLIYPGQVLIIPQ